MKNVKILKVVNGDMLKRCLKIREEVFTLEKGVSKEIEVDKYDCLNELSNHFLIKSQNDDIGTIRCLYVFKDTIKIQRFCFLEGYRGLGFGRIVMEYIENYYKNQGIRKIEMDAKYEVFSFYEKCGYKRVSDIFIEANIEHVKMMKTIQQ